MDEFFIGDTDFGVQCDKSHIELTEGTEGQFLLTVEIRGNNKVYEGVTADENSEWSWTLYPPHFYLRAYPMPEMADGEDRTIKLPPDASEEFDLALYMMEHCDVEDVSINLDTNQIAISGSVDLSGEMRKFRIKWTHRG